MQKEIWKDVVGYEGRYRVSNLGRVYSVRKKTIISQCHDTKGYCMVGLYASGGSKSKIVHKLVAMAFLDHTPCGMRLVVDHINNIKTDNRAENLQILTNRANCNKDRNKSFSSEYIGVFWSKNARKWTAQITTKRKATHLGYFIEEIDAHNAYQKALNLIEN